MIYITTDAVQMLADAVSATFANLLAVMATLVAIPIMFYIARRLIKLIPGR